MAQTSPIIISLGGSIIVPDEVDVKFLRGFRNLILKHASKRRFVIICGGGRTARKYMAAASEVVKLRSKDIDWIGINSTRLNASLLLALFKPIAHPKVIKNPTEKIKFKEKILIAAGWKPGFSTDYDAVLLAKNFGARTLVNLTNVDYVYDKNPSKFRDAKPIKRATWKEYKQLVGGKWSPGLNLPFDPIASKEAERLGLKVVIMNGTKLRNLEGLLKGRRFVGTEIS